MYFPYSQCLHSTMKYYYVTLLLYSAFLYRSYGQDFSTINRTLQDFSSEMRFNGSSTGPNPGSWVAKNYKGSVYLEESFINGKIYTRNNVMFSEMPMRYNALDDEVEVRMPDGKYYNISGKAEILKIQLNNREMVFTSYAASSGNKSGFLTVIYLGNSVLYKRNWKDYKEGTPSNGIIPETPPSIVDKPAVYFIAVRGEVPIEIKGKKDLITLMANHGPEVEAYCRKEILNLRQEADLAAAVAYFDSL